MGAQSLVAAMSVVARVTAVAGSVGCIAAAAASHGADGQGVQAVRFGGGERNTRIVVELDRAARGRVIAAGDQPGLMQIALAGAPVSGPLQGWGRGLVESWRIEPRGAGSRLKLTLDGPARVSRRFLLPPSHGESSYRYVIDIAATGRPGPAKTARLRLSQPEKTLHLKKVVVIDAGHGGRDPGAQGGALAEKDVTLAAALELKRRLERGGRYEVVLTRDDDRLVPLDSRVQIARQADADLFISLHADAGSEPGLRGASVYTLSRESAERAAYRLIDQPAGLTRTAASSDDRVVNRILLDLTQRATTSRSSSFAEVLLQRLADRTPLLRRGHRRAGFVVLLAPDVPAVLVEMGFLTNPEDEALLAQASGRARLIDSVAAAIVAYFEDKPARSVS